jgi:hypothetical protein
MLNNMPPKKASKGRRNEELRNSLNFFFVVAGTIALISFLVNSKITGMAVSEFAMPKYAFCENPVIENNAEDNSRNISCTEWIDDSTAMEKLDGISLILKRGNALVFSLDSNESDSIRIIGSATKEGSCIDIRPDYEGNMIYLLVTGDCAMGSTLIDYIFSNVKVKDEIAERFNYSNNTRMQTMLITTSEAVKIDGLFYDRITKIENVNEKFIGINDAIPELAYEYGSEYSDAGFNSSNSEICSKGCVVDENICIKFGTLWNGRYCDEEKVLKEKKERGNACKNNYECRNNLCKKGKCKKKFLWFYI